MAIPPFREDGWLPAGHHPAAWDEVTIMFGGIAGTRRAAVMAMLLAWRDEVRLAGMSGTLILDGSFISTKEEPGDFDALLVYDDATEELLLKHPEVAPLISYGVCKEKGFDLLVLSATAVRTSPMLCRTDAWDRDKNGKEKGVLEVDL